MLNPDNENQIFDLYQICKDLKQWPADRFFGENVLTLNQALNFAHACSHVYYRVRARRDEESIEKMKAESEK